MKLTIVADIFGEKNNGTSITARRLVENMKERGHQVKVVSCYKDEDETTFVTLPQRRFPMFNSYINDKNGVALAEIDETVLRQTINNSDVIHFLLPFKVCREGLKLARKYRIPYTSAFHCQPENITSHIFMERVTLPNTMIYRRFYRNFYRYNQFVHCPSKFIADQLTKNGYTMDKRVISNGVIPTFVRREVGRPEQYRDKLLILFTGRYSGEKRHDLLIKAAGLSKYADKIQLIFAGNGPRYDRLLRQASKLPNPPIFKLFTKEELCDTINYCDLYVHPSDVEIEAISCIEAFTCGLVPVISDSKKSATNQFSLCENNLFKHGDAKSLAQRIDYWLEHAEEKKLMAERYLEYAKQFSIKQCMDQMERMFLDAIDYYRDFYRQNQAAPVK